MFKQLFNLLTKTEMRFDRKSLDFAAKAMELAEKDILLIECTSCHTEVQVEDALNNNLPSCKTCGNADWKYDMHAIDRIRDNHNVPNV
jgi:hypothetical protein